MTKDKEIGEALLAGRSRPSETLALKIMKQEKERVLMLKIVAIVLWVLAAAAFALAVRSFFMFFYPVFAHWAVEIQPQGLEGRLHLLPRIYITATYVCVGLLGLAAITTIVLIDTSRKATLGQIRTSLAEISEELKQMKRESGAEHA